MGDREKYVMAIDLGTSGPKVALMTTSGRTVDYAFEPNELMLLPGGGAEQDPDDWWRATVKTIRAVVRKAKLKAADVRGIGLSGQMHGSVFLDKQNNVVRRALLWNDQRTAAECDEIELRAGGRDQ